MEGLALDEGGVAELELEGPLQAELEVGAALQLGEGGRGGGGWIP